MLNCVIDPCIFLRARSKPILERVSFGLEIVSLNVSLIMQATPQGMRPVWGIVYQAKGTLLGTENYVTNITAVGDPFLSDEALEESLTQGCTLLREARAKQLNGVKK